MNDKARIEVLEENLAKCKALLIQLHPVLSMLVRSYANDGRISKEEYGKIRDMLVDLYFEGSHE